MFTKSEQSEISKFFDKYFNALLFLTKYVNSKTDKNWKAAANKVKELDLLALKINELSLKASDRQLFSRFNSLFHHLQLTFDHFSNKGGGGWKMPIYRGGGDIWSNMNFYLSSADPQLCYMSEKIFSIFACLCDNLNAAFNFPNGKIDENFLEDLSIEFREIKKEFMKLLNKSDSSKARGL